MITKNTAQTIHSDIQRELQKIAAKHGLNIGKTRLAYGEGLKLTVEFDVEGGKSKEQVTYERWQKALGLPPLGTKIKFTRDGGIHCVGIVTGLRVGGRFKSCILQVLDKRYRMPHTQLIRFYKEQYI